MALYYFVFLRLHIYMLQCQKQPDNVIYTADIVGARTGPQQAGLHQDVPVSHPHHRSQVVHPLPGKIKQLQIQSRPQ